MPRGKCTLALSFALILTLLLPAGSQGATRSAFPVGFYGAGYGGNIELAGPVRQGLIWDRLAQAGVESTRVLFNWELAQRTPGGAYDWSRIDPLVLRAAKRRMEILPIVEYAPRWAKQFPNKAQSPPKGTADYTKFLRACIARYGPGSPILGKAAFWKAHPELPYKPIRQWQIWNEPEISFHWYRNPMSRPWNAQDAQQYVNLLKASYTTVKTADPNAKVVLAALSLHSWSNLKKLYDWTDIEGDFDVAAVQAYSGTPSYIPTILGNFRNALNSHGGGNIPIYVTEMTWPAACARVNGKWVCKSNPGYVRKVPYMKGYLTDKAGQAKRLTTGFKILRDNRAKWKLQRVYWYTAATSWTSKNEYEYSGLLRLLNGALTAMPSYFAYQKSAKAVQGCAKTAVGTCK